MCTKCIQNVHKRASTQVAFNTYQEFPWDFKHLNILSRSDLHLIYAQDVIHYLIDLSV